MVLFNVAAIVAPVEMQAIWYRASCSPKRRGVSQKCLEGAEVTTEEQEQLMSGLRNVAEHGGPWLQVVKVDAIRVALAEIERLTQENADLKDKFERESTEELTRKIAELAILCVDSKCDVIRLKRRVNTLLDAMLNGGALGRDDLKKEVVE